MPSRTEIVQAFKPLTHGTDGIGSWLGPTTDDRVFKRLDTLATDPVSMVQLNQLLAFGHEAPVSQGFFRYYWLSVPSNHPYDTAAIEGVPADLQHIDAISSVEQLRWGLTRLYTDALLYFGNVRTGYRRLRALTWDELRQFYDQKRFDTEAIRARGPSLALGVIPRDDRYLISEMACKSHGRESGSKSSLQTALNEAWTHHAAKGGGRVSIRKLLDKDYLGADYQARQGELQFSADDVLDHQVESLAEVDAKCEAVAARFDAARGVALSNTELYLSMVSDLDVYVATSMRNRDHFRKMAADCAAIFGNKILDGLHLRYFDPTLSAAEGHEDKGLIECLMVKCAKALVYCAGEKESYGKDAEAAMALSLGKPVIFYCSEGERKRFYRDVHPLSRLIEFSTGVAVGAIVTDNLEQVAELLRRVFQNRMEYTVEQSKPGHLRLVERLTGSVVRLQTADRMLTETFWNHYHNRDAAVLRARTS